MALRPEHAPEPAPSCAEPEPAQPEPAPAPGPEPMDMDEMEEPVVEKGVPVEPQHDGSRPSDPARDAENARLRALLAASDAEVARLRARLAASDAENARLREELHTLDDHYCGEAAISERRQRMGAKKAVVAAQRPLRLRNRTFKESGAATTARW